ncbi:MAG: Ppx/GppA phosphatase family protein [Myxococcota bacterium]
MPRQLAAVDLGSNSFHMIVAHVDEIGRITIVDKIKETVRLAAGLDADRTLSDDAAERALACLARFAERLAGIPPEDVRAVGTNTLRRARNALDFLEHAQETLGHQIDVISGREEARLIYAGVNQSFDKPGRRLVIDIGGGSTEIILGGALHPERLDSMYMGCVSWSRQFFPDGRLSDKHFERAITAARQQLGGVMRGYRDQGWDHALGTSGTIKAIEATLMQTGLTAGGITRDGLEALTRRVARFKHIDKIDLPGVPAHRVPVIAGGLAILLAAFRSLRIQHLTWVSTNLKEGLLAEIAKPPLRDEIRTDSVEHLAERLKIDRDHAQRVRATALGLLKQCQTRWSLSAASAALLGWAADLHEVGQFLAYPGYHKHGAYMVANADLPGFSRQDQATLAALILCHRGKFTWERIRLHAPGATENTLRLAILLRLATSFHRTRSIEAPPAIALVAGPRSLSLTYPDGWLNDRPLTKADLNDINDALSRVGYELNFR